VLAKRFTLNGLVKWSVMLVERGVIEKETAPILMS